MGSDKGVVVEEAMFARLRAIEAAARVVQAHYWGTGDRPGGADALDAALSAMAMARDERPVPEITGETRRLWEWVAGEATANPVTRETIWRFRYAVHGDAAAYFEARRYGVAFATLDDALLALVRFVVGDD